MATYIMAQPAPEWVHTHIRRAQSRHRLPSSARSQGPTYPSRLFQYASSSNQWGEP
jgi:hypothetical protein